MAPAYGLVASAGISADTRSALPALTGLSIGASFCQQWKDETLLMPYRLNANNSQEQLIEPWDGLKSPDAWSPASFWRACPIEVAAGDCDIFHSAADIRRP